MIEINLLPDDLRKGKRARRTRKAPGSGIQASVIFLILLLIGATSGAAVFQFLPYYEKTKVITTKKKEVAKVQAKVDKKRDEIGYLEEIEKIARTQLEVLSNLDPPDRLLWSEKLNLVSDLKPKNIYLMDIEVKETVKEIETESSKKNRKKWAASKKKGKAKGKEPKKVTRPVITQTMAIAGISAPDKDRGEGQPEAIQKFVDYLDRLKTHTVAENAEVILRPFTHKLSYINIGDWEEVEIGKRKVVSFNISMKTKELLKKEKEAAPAASKTTITKVDKK